MSAPSIIEGNIDPWGREDVLTLVVGEPQAAVLNLDEVEDFARRLVEAAKNQRALLASREVLSRKRAAEAERRRAAAEDHRPADYMPRRALDGKGRGR